jgi:hypothetical protein
MNKYLLLRSNKQSGPFTLDEMRAMGLKAYDLVWVEGKSAAWRYPGEIEELKLYAPPVEEQPFDRFFKKPGHENHSANTAVQSSVQTESRRYNSSTTEPANSNSGNRSVYINLPSEKTLAEEKNFRDNIETRQPLREKLQQEPVKKEPIQITFIESSPSAMGEPVGLRENFSQSLDEIKMQYAEKILAQKRRKKFQWRQYAQPVLLVMIMGMILAGGIFIGLSINKRGISSSQKDIAKDQLGLPDQQSSYTTKTIPISSSIPAQPRDKSVGHNAATDNSISDNPISDVSDNFGEEKKKTRSSRPKLSDSIQTRKVTASKNDTSSSLVLKQGISKTNPVDEKDAIKNNIEDYVSVTGSKYNVGTFGGISELQLTVSNSSPYPLDVVIVEVQYIQSNKKTFKTENMYFHNIGAGSALMQEAPKSPRGVKVKYRVTVINSKNNGISFSDI